MPTETYTTGRTATAEPMVTIPLAQYVEKVLRIQLLEDQAEIDRLNRENEELEIRRGEVVLKLYEAEKKLKEAGIA